MYFLLNKRYRNLCKIFSMYQEIVNSTLYLDEITFYNENLPIELKQCRNAFSFSIGINIGIFLVLYISLSRWVR